ncbi:hypothetical protein NDU88_000123 [Pleurodeles waltl]|uniref:Uncharacterized protein n=1 Tax=Pleurodeles waltl TaxID=8319 RepID=A0AAV7MJJ3_PLEWA|nr:hypothetical protein NDU88_000123 [Pleurodeles waltl]
MRSSRVAFESFFILHATNNKAHEEPARTRPGRVFALRSLPPRAAPRRHDHPRSGLAVTRLGLIRIACSVAWVLRRMWRSRDACCLETRRMRGARGLGCLLRRRVLSARDVCCRETRRMWSARGLGCLETRRMWSARGLGCLETRRMWRARGLGCLETRRMWRARGLGCRRETRRMWSARGLGCLETRRMWRARGLGCLETRRVWSARGLRCQETDAPEALAGESGADPSQGRRSPDGELRGRGGEHTHGRWGPPWLGCTAGPGG